MKGGFIQVFLPPRLLAKLRRVAKGYRMTVNDLVYEMVEHELDNDARLDIAIKKLNEPH